MPSLATASGLQLKASLGGDLNIRALAGRIGVTAYIASGYQYNIGLGDPLICADGATGGTVASAFEVQKASGTATLGGFNMIGTFAGIISTPDLQIGGTANVGVLPGGNLLSFQAGTTRSSGEPIQCLFIPTIYSPVYSIQVGSTAASLAAVWNYGTFVFQTVDGAGDQVLLNGDSSTGYLQLATNAGSLYNPQSNGSGYSTFQIIGFDSSNKYGNTQRQVTNVNLPYGSVLVRISASSFPNVSNADAFFV